jgi:hypothetical protein
MAYSGEVYALSRSLWLCDSIPAMSLYGVLPVFQVSCLSFFFYGSAQTQLSIVLPLPLILIYSPFFCCFMLGLNFNGVAPEVPSLIHLLFFCCFI